MKKATNYDINSIMLFLSQKIAGGSNIANSVYGTIVSIAVIGAFYDDPTSGGLETALSVISTLCILWIAHAYSHLVVSGINKDNIFKTLKHDWPLVQSGFLPIIILLLGEFGIIGERNSLLFASFASAFLLGFFCLSMARKNGKNWTQSILLSLFMSSLGILVALIEMAME